jgi:aminopeptidase YwaD
MNETSLVNAIDGYLHKLCVDLPHRHVGSPYNQQATTFFADTLATFGFTIECPQFTCIDWQHGAVTLHAGGQSFAAQVSPYALPCDVQVPLVAAATLEELQQQECTGNILLLHGDLTREQLMPKNFIFYNPAEHQHLIALLEQKQPAAIIAATSRNPDLAGGWYPFPLFEDGDFDIPSVYMTDVEGEKLLPHAGNQVALAYASTRIPSVGCNVIAHKAGTIAQRVVVCAHIDSKQTTPGALDNASGVATLLALASLLHHDTLTPTVEVLTLNGEDYYAASGHMHYLQANADHFDNIILAINLDLAGYRAGRTAWSSYDCPDEIRSSLHTIIAQHDDFLAGEPWYQSDHSLFLQQQRPAIAITSEHMQHLCHDITHTDRDTIELVDSRKLAAIAVALRELLQSEAFAHPGIAA